MEFKPLSYLQDAVSTRNTKDIRIALSSYIKKCLGNTQEIRDAENYVKNSLNTEEYNNIWEVYDGETLEKDKNKWNRDYFASLQGDLRYNFSKERFEHILAVGKYVYGSTQASKQNVNIGQARINANTQKTENRTPLVPILVGGGIALLLGVAMMSKLMKK